MESLRTTLTVFSASRTRWQGWYVAHRIVRLQQYFDVHYTGCGLPIKQRIVNKVAMMTFKILLYQQPLHLSELVVDYRPPKDPLAEPGPKTLIASRAFSTAGPRVWNSLPPLAHLASSIETLRSRAKTFTFNIAYSDRDDLSLSAPLTRCTETSLPRGSAEKLTASGEFETNVIWFDWSIDIVIIMYSDVRLHTLSQY